MRDPLIGRTLGDFVVREKIGEGGFGAVYRAQQPMLAREAVIKVLHSRLRASPSVTQRFLREARLASKLDHPYAAHIYAFGAEPDGLFWIAMELVRGTPLDALLETRGPIVVERLAPLLDRICEVVHTAHEQGIVHRDLKPANVIVLSRAGRYLPKLLDFGIARLLDDSSVDAPADEPVGFDDTVVPREAVAIVVDPDPGAHTDPNAKTVAPLTPPPDLDARSNPRLTQQGAVMGSPHYMAPEQWDDAGSADARSDLYALGILVYEALTTRKPFHAQSLTEIAIAHATKPIPSLGAEFPAALDAVLAKATAKAPLERYGTALELATAFRAAAGLDEGERAQLPAIDDALREAMIAEAPQPIAEAVAALAAAKNAHQAGGAVRDCVRVAVRWIGLLAVASRSRVGAGATKDAAPVVELFRALRRRALDDAEWLDLARELCRPFAHRRDAHPIPELVGLFFAGVDLASSRESLLEAPLLEGSDARGVSEDHVRELLAHSIPALARFLRAITFVSDYPLVVWRNERAEQWMGVRRPKRVGLAISGKALEPDKPTLCDREGRPTLALWPLAQVIAPAPGAPDEIFLFDGKGRRGARLVAMPQDFERHDDRVWPWFGASLLDTLDEPGEASFEMDTPYRGLAAFSAKDTNLFFGREREVEGFANRLRAQAMLAVVGPSGAGKSSFVHAGVLPSLPATWRAITIRPGAAPIAAIAARLAQEGLGEPNLAAGADALGAELRSHAASTRTTIVLVVDQFEELFTLCPAEERARFAELLVGAARSPEDPVRVVITLRDDFLVRAAEIPSLHTRIAQGLELLSTPGRADLLRIVIDPARIAGYDFEDPALPEEMVDAVAGEPGALALLSFAAQTLWGLRDRHFKQLNRRAYEAIGGVVGALAQHAEATLTALGAEEQRLCREAFRHLVTGAGTRAVLRRSELLQVLGSGARAEIVVDRLIAARLVVAREGEGGEDRIEIIHEALLGAWPRLVTWRREDAEGSRLRDQLRVAARQWDERKRAGGLLWRDEALAEYLLWRSRFPGSLTDVEEAFAAASTGDAAVRRRRRRQGLGAAFVALVGALGVVLWLNAQTARERSRAETSAAEARASLAQANEDRGRQLLLGGQAGRALMFLAEALRLGGPTPVLELLIARARAPVEALQRTLDHDGRVYAAVWTADGKRIITGGGAANGDGSAVLWDAITGAQLHVFAGHKSEIWNIAVSPDGTRLATASADHTARVWDLATGTVLAILGHAEEVTVVVFSPDSQRVITASMDHTVRVWDAATGASLFTLDHGDMVWAVAVSPDGTLIATGSNDGFVGLWNATTGARVATLAAGDRDSNRLNTAIGQVSFSPDGSRLLVASRDQTARIWDVASGREIARLVGHSANVSHAVFSPDGRRVATASDDRTARIWDAATGRTIATLGRHGGGVTAVAFDHAGTQVVTASTDNVVHTWNAEDGEALATFDGHGDRVVDATYSPTGDRIATASWDGSARIWSTRPDMLMATTPLPGFVDLAVRPGHEDELVGIDQTGSVVVVNHGNRQRVADARSAAYDAAGARLATIGDAARVTDLATGGVVALQPGGAVASDPALDRNVVAIRFSSDGRSIAGLIVGTIVVWEAASGRVKATIAMHEDVSALALSPSGDRVVVVVGKDHNLARIYDVSSGRLTSTLNDHGVTGWIRDAAFSPDAKTIVTAHQNGSARLWNVATSSLLGVFERHGGVVYSATFSHDGELLATTALDGTTIVWDVRTRQQLATLEQHSGKVFHAAFNADDTRLVTTAFDGVRTWNLQRDSSSTEALDAFIRCHLPFEVLDNNIVAADPQRRCADARIGHEVPKAR